ncbi:MAG: TlpA family protein disulfide reductase [Chitinophagaceae bacterium]|nr:TlpA family protein disulfide reductase [Chitinophagaceae bacterium]
MQSLNQKTIHSNKILLGKYSFINIWFEHCTPCIVEIPELNKLNEKYKKYMQVVSITFETIETIKRIQKVHNINYQLFKTSHNNTEKITNSNGYPTNLLVAPDGTILQIFNGGAADSTFSKYYFEYEIKPKLDSIFKIKY